MTTILVFRRQTSNEEPEASPESSLSEHCIGARGHRTCSLGIITDGGRGRRIGGRWLGLQRWLGVSYCARLLRGLGRP
jgi:hypothetical protein